ncbi:heat shock protein beta-7-like [Parambassis ranga]|uniref:Heat shock protein beta-7-like n=1 Tax=Parambassis ranga TaxID=210632 RepID=A0A6P7IBK9_9TELE|nr:heat shock protein beta-7-like [Parambassis ranga]
MDRDSVCMERGHSNLSEDSRSLPQCSAREHKFTGHSYPTGKIQIIGDLFLFTVDVSEFSPEDVIITSSNNLIEVHAEKLGEDGSVTNTFSHRCKLPSNVDPVTVSMSLESSGILTVRAHRIF